MVSDQRLKTAKACLGGEVSFVSEQGGFLFVQFWQSNQIAIVRLLVAER